MEQEDSVERVRLGLVGTDPLRVLGLEEILSEIENLDVVALSVAGAMDLQAPSLIVVDASCTENLFDLLATFRRKRPGIKLIVLGLVSEPMYIQQVIGSGAKGYLTHSATEREIRMAIGIVQDGSVWAPRKVLARLLEDSAEKTKSKHTNAVPFTEREIEVLRLLVMGRTNREIAQSLGIDEVTVKGHVGRLMRKVGVDNRIALTVHAMQQGIGVSE